jgi:hypothetical protein
MRPSRTGLNLTLLLLLAPSCRCNGDSAHRWPVPTPSTLSILSPRGLACEWAAFDALAGVRTVLATFDHPCIGGTVTWNKAGDQALIWFDFDGVDGPSFSVRGVPEGFVKPEVVPPPGLPLRAYLLDKDVAEPKPLHLPPGGDVARLGFGANGRILALTREVARLAADGTVDVAGKAVLVDKDREGQPIVVRAWEWEADAWRQVEARLSDSGWDYAQGLGALTTHAELSDDSTSILSPHPAGKAVDAAALMSRLAAYAPKLPNGDYRWLALTVGADTVYVWEITIELVWATGLLLIQSGDTFVVPPALSFTAGDMVAPVARAPFLLVATSGRGTHPRLYDVPGRRLVYSSDVDRAVVFWPEAPARPSQ